MGLVVEVIFSIWGVPSDVILKVVFKSVGQLIISKIRGTGINPLSGLGEDMLLITHL